MGKVVKKLFGGTDKDLRKQIEENTAGAQKTALQFFPAGEENRNRSTSQALDILGQSLPQQMSTFQDGNVAAQQNLIEGLQGSNAAIMGDPLSGGFTPFRAALPEESFHTAFADQLIPEFKSMPDALLERDAGTSALLDGVSNDAELFLAAADGRIKGFGKGDRDFFRNLVNANTEAFAASTRFVDDPAAYAESLIDKKVFKQQNPGIKDRDLPAGLLDGKNVRRIRTLANKFKGL